MRTTLSIDDDVLEQVKDFAKGRRISLGRAASELIRRGVERPLQTHIVNGLHVITLPPGSPTVSSERVNELLHSEYDDEFQKAIELMKTPKRKA
jgi:hypothetical protein